MAGWSMEPPAALWMPCDLHLANWCMDPSGCAPGHPTELFASTELFGTTSCYQTSVPICEGRRQQCEYEVATQYHPIVTSAKQETVVVDIKNTEEGKVIQQNPIHVFKKVADECQNDVNIIRKKMHRYPASIRAMKLDKWYTEPTLVAIGPYYHGRENLQQAEKMKHVAAYQCILDSPSRVEEMYSEVVAVALGVRKLYDKDVGDHDFLPMMFYDACFLVQYMLIMSGVAVGTEESLSSFFDSNGNEIFHDIMLLENQIPWPVVETVMNFAREPVPMKRFIKSVKECLLDRKSDDYNDNDNDDDSYKPPHLLGLIRFHIVGKRSKSDQSDTQIDRNKQISLSVSANELAEMGIRLEPNQNTELVQIGAEKTKWPIFGYLYLPPLSLDDARTSFLVSMAALELCTTPSFGGAEEEDSAVCSYLLLLAMLISTEEDVQKLRAQHVLLGAGRSNSEVVNFFTKLHGLRLGSSYIRTMMEIERYRNERRTRTTLYGFFYRNKKTIAAVGSIVVGVVGTIGSILGTLNKSPGSS